MEKLRRVLEQQGTVVQTLIFSKEKFKTAEEAKRWAGEHGSKNPHGNLPRYDEEPPEPGIERMRVR